jgi:ribosome-associated heat shock protein Hsp15
MEGSDNIRVDVWLWRARFFKTRALACRVVEEGRVRLTRATGEHARLDKGSRCVRPGDELVFALAGRVHAVRILALGERRGPAEEARGLYAPLDAPDSARQGDAPHQSSAQ